MRMKRGRLVIFVGILVLLIVPLASAGYFSDLWGKITGYAESGTTSLNITIGNSAPTIPWVESISATNPTDDTTKAISFNFTATDTDGMANLDNSTAEGYFTRAGESTRSNSSCIPRNASTNSITFTCTVYMWYYDENGAWDINATIQDTNNAVGDNTTETFTYNSLLAMKMSPTALTWPSIGLTDTDTGSDDPIQVNNTGNDISLSINVTSYNLEGNVTTTDYIYANNFTIDNVTAGCSGTYMANATSINITNATLERGNHSLNYNNATSGQERLFFCLKGVIQTISSQGYTSAEYGSWTVTIIT